MSLKLEPIDVFCNSKVILMRRASHKVFSWISVLIIGSLMFGSVFFFYKYEDYDIYYANVVKDEENNYIKMMVDESFIENQNRNYLEISNTKYRCHLLAISDNYYMLNESKYWETSFVCDLPDELNINNNVIEVKVEKGKMTLYDLFIRKIRKELKNARIKN